jgi:hypothetical protein
MAYQLTAEDQKLVQQMANSGQFKSVANAKYNSDSTNAIKPKKSQSKNLLTSLLPTAGSILGGIGGTFLAPGVGTAAGGAVGGGIGKTLENLFEGNSAGDGVLGEAALGTLGGLGKAFKAGKGAINALKAGEGTAQAGKVARYGVQGAQALDNGADGLGVLDKAVTASKANTSQSTLGKIAEKLDSVGGRTLASQSKGSLTGGLARQAPETFKAMNKYGYNNVDDFQKVASHITGNEGAVNVGKMNILANSTKTVNPGDWMAKASEKLKSTTGITTRDDKAIRNILAKTDSNVQKALADRLGTSRAAGIGEAHPEELYRAAQDLQSKAYDALGPKGSYALASDAQKAKFDVLNDSAKSLKKTIYSSVGKDSITPAMKQDMIMDLRSRGVDSPHLIKEIQGANTLDDLNKIETPFVKASQIGSATEAAANTRTVGVPSDLRGTTLTGLGLNAVAPTAARMGGSAAIGASGLLGKLGGKAANNPLDLAKSTALGMAGAQAPFRLGDLLSGDQAQAQGEDQIDPTTGMPVSQTDGIDLSLLASLTGEGTDDGSSMSGAGYTLDQLMNDIQNNDPKNAATLIKLYELSNPSGGKGTAAQQKALGNAQSGENALNQVSQLYNQAGGGQGLIGGTLSNLAGKLNLNSSAGAYNDVSGALVAQIAKAMGNSGTLSDKDISIIKQSLPNLTDSPERAQAKLQSLQELLATSKQNAMYAAPSASDDTSSLLAQLSGA